MDTFKSMAMESPMKSQVSDHKASPAHNVKVLSHQLSTSSVLLRAEPSGTVSSSFQTISTTAQDNLELHSPSRQPPPCPQQAGTRVRSISRKVRWKMQITLGITFGRDEDESMLPGLKVARLKDGGVAALSGRISVGDR